MRTDAGFPLRGPLAFASLSAGKPYTFSLHELYRAEEISALNAVIFGHYGYGKSSLVKSVYVMRQLGLDGNAPRVCVFDRKQQQQTTGTAAPLASDVTEGATAATGGRHDGEYMRLASELGGTRVVFDRNPARGARINILDPAFAAMGSEETLIGQDELLRMAAEVAMGRTLDSFETAALATAHQVALQTAKNRGRIPQVSDVIDALFVPHDDSIPGPTDEVLREEFLARGQVTTATVADWGLRVAVALRQFLPGGQLSGLIDGETRDADGGPLDLDSPLIVFDTSALAEGSTALAFMMAVASAFIQARWLLIPGDKTLIVEEGYNLDSLPGIPAVMRGIAKRGRACGCAVVSVFHHLSDLKPGSELWALVKETDVAHFFYQGSAEDIQAIVDFFNLDPAVAKEMSQLEKGCHLLRVKNRPVELVQHIRTPEEEWLTNTDMAISHADVARSG
jgi:hypothetical protein